VSINECQNITLGNSNLFVSDHKVNSINRMQLMLQNCSLICTDGSFAQPRSPLGLPLTGSYTGKDVTRGGN
jgi:hypothetical protein